MSDKKIIKKKLIIEGLLAIFIALTPILFYCYKYIPDGSSDSWNILGITFTNNGYENVSYAIYFYLSKLIPLVLAIIWFATCKHWWYHTILIPISMYAFQLYGVFSEDADNIDENELRYLLIVCMIIIPIVYFIRVKLFDKYVHGIDLEAMEAELQELKEKPELKDTNEKESFTETDEAEISKNESFSDELNRKLSTGNIENGLKQIQNRIQNWLHVKF